MLAAAKQFGLWGASGGTIDPLPAGQPQGKADPPGKPNVPKEKKPPTMKKILNSKINMLGTKLTDLRVLRNRTDSSPLLLGPNNAITDI